MREIKFRCWDKENSRMILPSGSFMDVSQTQGVDRWVFGLDVFNHPDNIELMQFTGLFDKNGKEIFEGDVVKFQTKGGNTMVYEVRWKNRGFNLKHMPQFSPNRMTPNNKNEIEIIGNIHENPELLNN